MQELSIPLSEIPSLAQTPAAFGALASDIQLSGSSLFEIVIATVTARIV